MNKRYESVIIIASTVTEEKIQSIINKVATIVESNKGKIVQVEKMGIKKLAYEIKKFKEGYYIAFEFLVEDTVIAEIEKFYRESEDIIKHLTIQKEEQNER